MLTVLLALCAGCRTAQVPASSRAVRADGYSADEVLAYFGEIAFASEYGGWRGCLCKWGAPIVYMADGAYTEEDVRLLEELCGRLNGIPGFPGIRRAEPDEAGVNFTVSFVDAQTLEDRFGEDARGAFGMSRFYWETDTGVIVRAEAAIRADTTPAEAKMSVICEEFLQSLGLAADSYAVPESVFYEGYSTSTRPAPIDWALLELLYSDALAPGAANEAAMDTARKLLSAGESQT